MDISETTEPRTCAKHGAYQAKVVYILDHRIVQHCAACEADKKIREAEYANRTAAEASKRRIEHLFNRAGIPPRFQGRTFDNYDANEEGQQRALRIARKYVEMWPDMLEKGTGLIFSGKRGTGKTHLACAIANAVIKQGSSALFTTVSDALRSVKRAYDRTADTSEGEAINALVEPRLLILDEAGADFGTEHSKTLLFDIINKRYEMIRPTIILTNLDAAALREYFGERVMDRMREGGGKLVPFVWESFRA